MCELAIDLQDKDHPIEVRTLACWFEEITNWHRTSATNGPTEADNLIKRIKRVGFGFRPLAHYRIRVLLYARRPNWGLLATLTPPLFSKGPFVEVGAGRRQSGWDAR